MDRTREQIAYSGAIAIEEAREGAGAGGQGVDLSGIRCA